LVLLIVVSRAAAPVYRSSAAHAIGGIAVHVSGSGFIAVVFFFFI